MGAESKKIRRCIGVYRTHTGTVYSLDVKGPPTTPVVHTQAKKKNRRVAPVDREGSTGADPNAVTMITGSHDKTAIVWDVHIDSQAGGDINAKVKAEKKLGGHAGGVHAVELVPMPDGPLHALTAGDQTIRFWDLEETTVISTYAGHTGPISCLRLRGKKAFTGSADGTLRSWHLETGKHMHTFQGHKQTVNAIDVTDLEVYTGSRDNDIIQWSRMTGEPVAYFVGHTDAVQCLQCHGKLLLSGSMDKTIRVWDQKAAETIRVLKGHDGGVECLTAVKGVVFTGSYDKTIRCYKINTGDCVAVFEGHTDGVYCVRFYGDLLFSGSGDKSIRLWDARGLASRNNGGGGWFSRLFKCR